MEQQRGRAGYQVFVLRLWRDQEAGAGRPEVWRCSLEEPRTRQRRAFASVDEMGMFLDAVAGGDQGDNFEGEV
jgi:hypothetical protein